MLDNHSYVYKNIPEIVSYIKIKCVIFKCPLNQLLPMLLLENNIKINKESSSVFSIKSFKFLTKKLVINGKISNKIKTYKSLKSPNYSNNTKTLQKSINLLLLKIKHNNLKFIYMIVLKNYYKLKVILIN